MGDKFFNIRTTIDGIEFDSRGEAARYAVLKERQANGLISHLRLQVSYPLVVNGRRITTYIADFVYNRDGKTIVEDSKTGLITDLYKVKRRLMLAIHDITIYETTYANDP